MNCKTRLKCCQLKIKEAWRLKFREYEDALQFKYFHKYLFPASNKMFFPHHMNANYKQKQSNILFIADRILHKLRHFVTDFKHKFPFKKSVQCNVATKNKFISQIIYLTELLFNILTLIYGEITKFSVLFNSILYCDKKK